MFKFSYVLKKKSVNRGICSLFKIIVLSTTTKNYTCLPLTEKAMAPHSRTLTWKIPWTEEPGGLQSMGSLRVRHDWATAFSVFPFMHWRRKWQPNPVFFPGESQGRGSLMAAISGITQSRTWLSSSSSSLPLRSGKSMRKEWGKKFLLFIFHPREWSVLHQIHAQDWNCKVIWQLYF